MAVHQAVLDNNLDKLETLIEVTIDKCTRASNEAFSWLKEPTSDYYAKRTLTPQKVDVKLVRHSYYHKERVALRHYANPPHVPYDLCISGLILRLLTVGSTTI